MRRQHKDTQSGRSLGTIASPFQHSQDLLHSTMPKTPTLKLESASNAPPGSPLLSYRTPSRRTRQAGSLQLSLPSSPLPASCAGRGARPQRVKHLPRRLADMVPSNDLGANFANAHCNSTEPWPRHAGATSAFRTPQRVPSIAVQRSTEKGGECAASVQRSVLD